MMCRCCAQDTLPSGQYFRFSPEGTAFGVSIDQTERTKIEELQAATHLYISQQSPRSVQPPPCDMNELR